MHKDSMEENTRIFMNDLVKVMEKHEDKVTPEDMITALQSILFTVVFNSAPSQEEAADFLHDSIDEFLESTDEEVSFPDDATIALK